MRDTHTYRQRDRLPASGQAILTPIGIVDTTHSYAARGPSHGRRLCEGLLCSAECVRLCVCVCACGPLTDAGLSQAEKPVFYQNKNHFIIAQQIVWLFYFHCFITKGKD